MFVDAGATLTSHATIIDDGASLDVAGRFFGTDGNDTFASSGSVQGDLAFGAGDDAVTSTIWSPVDRCSACAWTAAPAPTMC